MCGRQFRVEAHVLDVLTHDTPTSADQLGRYNNHHTVHDRRLFERMGEKLHMRTVECKAQKTCYAQRTSLFSLLSSSLLL